jgi:hypothetical protein
MQKYEKDYYKKNSFVKEYMKRNQQKKFSIHVSHLAVHQTVKTE